MMAQFDKSYWEDHWAPRASSDVRSLPPNPYLQSETTDLQPTTVLDAGCGSGTEALWLAEQGWQVTAVDISATALATAQARATATHLQGRIKWVEADLPRWEPARTWDRIVTNYAHSNLGQLAFYRRVASWVAPGGALLIVGDLHGGGQHAHDHPEDAKVTWIGITGLFTGTDWYVESDYENTRIVHPGGNAVQLRDVIVRLRRLL